MGTTTRAGDYAWGLLAGLMAVLTTLNTVGPLGSFYNPMYFVHD